MSLSEPASRPAFQSPHGASDELPRDLRALLAALARHARAGHQAFDPHRLAALGRELLLRRRLWSDASSPGLVDFVRRRAHALRQAALLRAAVELRLALNPAQRIATAPAGRPPSHDAWAAAASGELDRVLREELPLDATLLACALLAPAEWPAASSIARAALRLDATAPSKLCLARARFAAGERMRAEAGYRALLAGCDLAGLRAPLHEALGCAIEHRGAIDAARAEFERAELCGAGPRAGLAGLGLALVAGERAAVGALADRLETALAEPFELGRAARELRLRWELAGNHADWRARALSTRAWSELARASTALHLCVARELFDAADLDAGARR